jgi:hypothetical protein
VVMGVTGAEKRPGQDYAHAYALVQARSSLVFALEQSTLVLLLSRLPLHWILAVDHAHQVVKDFVHVYPVASRCLVEGRATPFYREAVAFGSWHPAVLLQVAFVPDQYNWHLRSTRGNRTKVSRVM